MKRQMANFAGIVTLALALGGCGPQEPIRIGLIAGLSDRGSDFGESVRNGVILAVEQQNQAGGIKGRKIELIVRDDGQNAEQARRAARELIDLRPEVVIGPVTSSMAAVVVPLMNEAQLTLISPTVMSPDFHGKDDRFFRVNRTTTEAGIEHARILRERKLKRVGIAFDASNPQYSDTWRQAFVDTFTALGGEIAGSVGFSSIATPRFSEIIGELLAGKPDTLLFISSSLDTARLCQQARQQAPALPLSSTEWAASGEFLTEMGGEAVEGLLISHAYDRNDQGAAFRAFRDAFKARFQRDFGSFSLMAYDTANIIFSAMKHRSGDEDMKRALLKYGPYAGVQQQTRFDDNGDTPRKVYYTEIRKGSFVQVK